MKNLRELILTALQDVEAGVSFSHIALKNLLDKNAELEKNQRAFITRELEGVLERKLTLDHIIGRFVKDKKSVRPVIRNLLRMGTFELYFMDSVPPSATVNEIVKLAEKKGLKGLKGFVNGVLRNIDRKRIDLSALPPAYVFSIPEEILNLLTNAFGEEEALRIAAASLVPAPLTVHFNTLKKTEEEILHSLERANVTAEKWEDVALAYRLRDLDRLPSLPAFSEGLLFVQDLSSMLALDAAHLNAGMKILDLCSAPGGKSFYLYERLRGNCEITACDLTPEKTELIRENAKRLSFDKIKIEEQDARVLREDRNEAFDLVVADLPCSGLGVMGRKKDLKYRITAKDMKELAALQREILNNAAHYVRKGGELLYSTCTLNPKENQENAARFIAEHKEFEKVREETILPMEGKRDGFYFALFHKT